MSTQTHSTKEKDSPQDHPARSEAEWICDEAKAVEAQAYYEEKQASGSEPEKTTHGTATSDADKTPVIDSKPDDPKPTPTDGDETKAKDLCARWAESAKAMVAEAKRIAEEALRVEKEAKAIEAEACQVDGGKAETKDSADGERGRAESPKHD